MGVCACNMENIPKSPSLDLFPRVFTTTFGALSRLQILTAIGLDDCVRKRRTGQSSPDGVVSAGGSPNWKVDSTVA